MVLPLAEDWRVYEDYLAGMTSKYRSGIRQQIFKPIEAAGCEIGVMTPEQVDAQAERMQQLYLAVQDNATLRPVTVTADYWRRMAALGPERAELRGLWRDGDLLGFLLVLKDGAEVTAAQIGFDRAAARRCRCICACCTRRLSRPWRRRTAGDFRPHRAGAQGAHGPPAAADHAVDTPSPAGAQFADPQPLRHRPP